MDDLCKQFEKKMDGNNEIFENFKRNKYLKKLPSMQRVKRVTFTEA